MIVCILSYQNIYISSIQKKIMFKDIEIDKDKPNLTEDKRFDQDHYVS